MTHDQTNYKAWLIILVALGSRSLFCVIQIFFKIMKLITVLSI